MGRLWHILAYAAFMAAGCFAEELETGADQDRDPDGIPIVARQFLVKFHPGADTTEIALLNANNRVITLKTYDALPQMALLGLTSASASLEEVAAAYESHETVEAVAFNYRRNRQVLPNDPLVLSGTQWHLNNTGQSGGVADADVDALEAWETRSGAPGIVVAVIDSGVRYTHEDLAGNMWSNPGETPGNGIDDDGNGYIDDAHGINVVDGTGDPLDDTGHGTHVAGIIGAVGNNGLGVSGVAWDTQIMALKFLESDGSGTDADAIECINYAIAKDADIINLSWGGIGNSQILKLALQEASDAGIFIVASAGNQSVDIDVVKNYPASFDVEGIITVTATDRSDALDASFANFGESSVDLAAPGSSIYSTYFSSDSSYRSLSGTSMAAPHVSAALALMLSEFPGESTDSIRNRLLASVDPLPSLAGRTRSGGRLNLRNALRSEVTPSNDDFANAANLSGIYSRSASFNTNATTETGEPAHAAPASGKSVWWRWIAPSSDFVEFSTAGSDFQSALAIYTGESLGALNLVGGAVDNADTPEGAVFAFSPVADETYWIAVDGWNGATGNIKLRVAQAVLNDDFASRAEIQGINVRLAAVNNEFATAELGEPSHAGNDASHSLWWTWRSPVSGLITVSTSSSNSINTVLGIYEGDSLATLLEVASDDDSGVGLSSEASFFVEKDDVYALSVDGWQGETGDIVLSIVQGDNDQIAASRSRLADSFSDFGYTKWASKEPFEPDHGGNQGGSSIWWAWTASRTGQASVDTFGSDFDTTLSVYQGEDMLSLSQLQGNDDDAEGKASRVLFDAVAGTEYRIAVDGHFSESNGLDFGLVSLNASVEEDPLAAFPVFEAVALPIGGVGNDYALQLVASGDPDSYEAEGLPPGLSLDASAALLSGQPTQAGTYRVTFKATNESGVGTYVSELRIAPDNGSPSLLAMPAAQSVVEGDTLIIASDPVGTGPFLYQWFKDEELIFGATAKDYAVAASQLVDEGSYTVRVSNAFGAILSDPIVVRVSQESLANISTLGIAGPGSKAMVAGFVVSGDQPRTLLIRAVGPTLSAYGVGNPISDPAFTLKKQNELIANVDNWGALPNKAEIQAMAVTVGAFPLDSDLEAADVFTLLPGIYTAEVSGAGGEEGVAIIEAYDTTAGQALKSRLVNISTLVFTSEQEQSAIAGFVVHGNEAKKLLVRAVGPTLQDYGVGDVLPDPILELYAGEELIYTNIDWTLEEQGQLGAIFQQVGAFQLRDDGFDAAFMRILPPGSYTVKVRDLAGRSGKCLIEVYEVL